VDGCHHDQACCAESGSTPAGSVARGPGYPARSRDRSVANNTSWAPELTVDLRQPARTCRAALRPCRRLSGLRYDVDAGQRCHPLLRRPRLPASRSTWPAKAASAPDLRGTLSLPEFSPRRLRTRGDAGHHDPAVLVAAGSANWFLRDKSFGLEQLAVVLDDRNSPDPSRWSSPEARRAGRSST
jgi:hypothetical protein